MNTYENIPHLTFWNSASLITILVLFVCTLSYVRHVVSTRTFI